MEIVTTMLSLKASNRKGFKNMTDDTELLADTAVHQFETQPGLQDVREFFLVFLNSNEVNRFEAEEIMLIREDAIIDFLLGIARYRVLPLDRLKKYAKAIGKASNGAIPHSRCLEIMARGVGYAHFHELLHSPSERGMIFNRVYHKRLQLNLLTSQVEAESSRSQTT